MFSPAFSRSKKVQLDPCNFSNAQRLGIKKYGGAGAGATSSFGSANQILSGRRRRTGKHTRFYSLLGRFGLQFR